MIARLILVAALLLATNAASEPLYFAEVDKNGVVVNVIVVNSEALGTATYPESETLGVKFLENLLGPGRTWKQTSYTSEFKQAPAVIGDSYNSIKDAFEPKK